MTGRGPRPYPVAGDDVRDVELAALRALGRADDPQVVRQVVATVVSDLGGALVPARLEPESALEPDVSLGLGEPVLVVVDPLSVAAMDLRATLPGLLEQARAALTRLRLAADAVLGDAAVPAHALSRYLDLLSTGQLDTARRLVSTLVEQGSAPAAVVTQVLAPAQDEVGRRWYAGAWSVADEHAASAVTEACVLALPTGRRGPRVLVACPDGEWHALPSRMLAVAAADVRPQVLGPGLPADHLERYLDSQQPDALALSCTLSTNLLQARASIAAAHRAGVPVVAGGRAFGPDGLRAARLGADAWGAAAEDLGGLADGLVLQGVAAELHPEVPLADAVSDAVLELALERHEASSTWVAGLDARRRRQSLEDLRWTTRHAAAALLCDDDRVLDDLLTWLADLLAGRGVPQHVLLDGTAFLADALEPETPRTADLLRRCAARLS